MKKILNTIWVMGVLSLAVFCLSACDRDLDVQQSYPFTVETMPVQKDIIRGQTAEIRCTLKRGGEFADTRYTIRYFQSDGKGLLRMITARFQAERPLSADERCVPLILHFALSRPPDD